MHSRFEMDPNALRNFRDFLQLYNKMTEICFTRCVDNINSRNLDQNEVDCVEDCSSKFVKFNNKLMQNFVEVQTAIVNKTVKAQQAQYNEFRHSDNNLGENVDVSTNEQSIEPS